ncbi:MAG: glycosyltransferase family 4 protein [Candidatus Hadarchaeales archaeon]
MKIAHLAWESLHSIRVGGLATVVSKLAEETAKRGNEVHVFTRWSEGYPEYEYINGVNYHRCKFNPGSNILELARNMSKAMVSAVQETERYRGRFDIIHGHDWHVVDALNDLKQMGRKIVITFHSTEYGRNGGIFGDWWEFGEISGKEWYGGYIADRITTVSNAMKNELSWLYKVPTEKIDVIPNAVEPREYQMHVDPGRVKEKYGIHPLAPTVGFLGRMTYQKGPDLLMEAIPRVIANRWDVKFIFAGEGGMRPHLERRAHELGVAHATRFLGFIPFWAHLELLNTCDIICIPSRNEPFGIVLLEAWATGRPVVATEVGGLGENIENFVDGVKVYVNPDSVAWGINYLINSANEMKRISAGALEKVKKFNWRATMDALNSTYHKVIG